MVYKAPPGHDVDDNVSLNVLSGPDGARITTRAASPDDNLFNYIGRNIELFYVRYLEIKGLSRLGYENYYDERHVPEHCRRPHNGRTPEQGTDWQDRPCHNQ